MISRAIVCLVLLTLGACNSPPFPERHARVALERRHYSEEIIGKVVRKEPLERKLVHELAVSKDLNVRYLVAANPSLERSDLDLLMVDRVDFVRAGAAINPRISRSQMEVLFNDPSTTVTGALARNPSVPGEMLFKLHRSGKASLTALVLNPECPASIVDEAGRSERSTTRSWAGIHPNASPAMRKKLANDSDPMVRDFIRNNSDYWNRRKS